MIEYSYHYEVMNTTFSLNIISDSVRYANSVAEDLHREIISLEETLSMFKYGSDVSIINSMKVGEICNLNESTFECLCAALYANKITCGVIDVCMGEYFMASKNIGNILRPKKLEIMLSSDTFEVKKISDGKLDLGAIAKGYALELLAEKLSSVWGIEKALLSLGGSSILALDSLSREGWNVTFGGEKIFDTPIKNCSIGASGIEVQGNHILDCRTGDICKNLRHSTWVVGDSACLCDALSTAFMILPEEKIFEISKELNLRVALKDTEFSEIKIIS